MTVCPQITLLSREMLSQTFTFIQPTVACQTGVEYLSDILVGNTAAVGNPAASECNGTGHTVIQVSFRPRVCQPFVREENACHVVQGQEASHPCLGSRFVVTCLSDRVRASDSC